MKELLHITLDEYLRSGHVARRPIPSALIVDDPREAVEMDRLHKEMEDAGRWADELEEMGARITFRCDSSSGRLDIQVWDDSGNLLARIEPSTLVDLVGRERDELAAWLTHLHRQGGFSIRAIRW